MKKLLLVILLLGAASVWANPMTVPQDVLTIAQANDPEPDPLRLRLRVFLEGPLRGGSSSAGDPRTGSRSDARALALGRNVSGTIQPGITHYYRFTLSSRALVGIGTTGMTDTILRLENNAGTVLAESGNINIGGANIRIVRTLEPGTYYIAVAGVAPSTTGSYTLVPTALSTTGLPPKLGTRISGTIQPGIVDAYEFTLDRRSEVILETTSTIDTAGILADGMGTVLATADDIDRSGGNLNFRINEILNAGTYYISVRGFAPDTTGSYTLLRTTIPVLTFGLSEEGDISPEGDVDEWSFALSERSEVTIETVASTPYTFGRLLRSDGSVLADSDDFSSNAFSGGARVNGNKNFSITQTLEAGSYYMRVSACWQRFRDGDCDRSIAQGSYALFATAIPALSSIDRAEEAISPAGDVDRYQFILSSRSEVVIQTTGMTDTFGRLENSMGTELATSDDISKDDENFRITRTLEAGTYYIEVSGHDSDETGSYIVFIDTIPALTLGESASGDISPTGDRDRYQFALSSRAEVTFETTGMTDIIGTLFDSRFNELAEDADISGENLNFRITQTLAAGTYYIWVEGERGATGTYTLITKGELVLILGESVSGVISPAGDVDRYRFTLSSRTQVTFETTGSTDTFGRLYDSEDTQLTSNDDSGPGYNFRIVRTLAAGTYYITVEEHGNNSTGSYTLITTTATP